MPRSGSRWGWVFASFGAAVAIGCSPPRGVVITSPAHGTFSTGTAIAIEGMVVGIPVANASVTLNGSPVSLTPGGTFSESLSLDPSAVFNPVEAVVTDTRDGFSSSHLISVIAGDAIPDGVYSPQSVALRINDSGLVQLEPIVATLADIDPSTIVSIDTVVFNGCVVRDPLFGWCVGSAVVTVVNPPASFGGFGVSMDSMTNFVAGDIQITDLVVHLDIDGSGLVPSCPLTITANTTGILGDYGLSPDAVDPNSVDVDQIGGVSVSFGNFNDDLSGLCDVPIIGDIIQLFLPNLEPLVRSGLEDVLDDPDGAGPVDAPIADALEAALAGVEIAGPIGESLGVVLETPLFQVVEDVDGLTMGSDSRMLSDIGTGPGQCDAPASAPDLTASLHVPETFPTLGATTPVSGLPYDLGICISTSAFNQLLKAGIECGLLQLQLTEFDFGLGLQPITTSNMALIIPEFAVFPPGSPLILGIRPTLAPVVTGNAGPGGELAEVRAGHLIVEVLDATPGVTQPLLKVAVDFRAGLDLSFDDLSGELVPVITSVSPLDIDVVLIDNLIGTNAAALQVVLPQLLAVALPEIAGSLGAFPLPAFLGLDMNGVEVSRGGEFLSLFVDLVPAP